MKISAIEYNDALLDDEPKGNTLEDSIEVCRWLEAEGVDAIHVSSGSFFPHPRNPAGELPIEELRKTYDTLISSGLLTGRNYLLFNGRLTGGFFKRRWERARGDFRHIEGMNLPDAHRIKQAVKIPVLCTGGFQTATVIEQALADGLCDGVTIARPLIANNDLVKIFAAGVARSRSSPAPTATSAWSTPSRTRSGATRSSASPRATRWCARSCRSSSPRRSRKGRKMVRLRIPGIVVALFALVCTIAVRAQTGTPDSDSFPDANDHFRYGSIGTEEGVGLPYWIWKVLPTVFEDKLPKRPGVGYERIGFLMDGTRHAPPDRHVVQAGARRARRAQLRDVPRRHVSREPDDSAAARLGNARQPHGPAGLCELPDRVRQRPALQLRDVDGGHPQGESGYRLVRAPALQAVRRRRHEERHPRARARERVVRPASAVRPRPRRHVQSVQGHPQAPGRRRRGHGRSAVALEPADAGADVAALGRQQRLGRRAEQERGDWRRRDAGLARSRVDEAHRELDSGSQAAALPGGAHRQGARERRAPRVGAGVRELPRGRAARSSDRSRASPTSAPIPSGSTRLLPSWRAA